VIAASMTGGVVAGWALGKALEWAGIRTVPLLPGIASAMPGRHPLADPHHLPQHGLSATPLSLMGVSCSLTVGGRLRPAG
jgi:hypothetical protein